MRGIVTTKLAAAAQTIARYIAHTEKPPEQMEYFIREALEQVVEAATIAARDDFWREVEADTETVKEEFFSIRLSSLDRKIQRRAAALVGMGEAEFIRQAVREKFARLVGEESGQ